MYINFGRKASLGIAAKPATNMKGGGEPLTLMLNLFGPIGKIDV
jgi:hypothetical protein